MADLAPLRSFPPISVNLATGTVSVAGTRVELTLKQARLLFAIVGAWPDALTHRDAMRRLYGDAEWNWPESGVLKVYVCHIRKALAPLGVSIGSKYAAGYRLDRFPGSGTHLPPVRQGEPPVGEGDGTAPSPVLSHANSLSTPREDCPGDRGPLGRANTSPDDALGADVDEASTGQSGRPAGECRNAQGVSNRDVSTDGKPYAPDAPQGNPGPAQAIAEPVTVETMAREPAVHETQFIRTENTPAEAGDRPPPVEGRAASAPRGVRPCAPGACHRTGEPADE